MRIIVDGFGGDKAPEQVIKGCAMAVEQLGVEITLTGNIQTMDSVFGKEGVSKKGITLVDAKTVMDVHEEPTRILKEQNGSSMAVGLKLLAEGAGDAFVSAGSTGALMVGSTFIVKRMKGIKRGALAPIMPSAKGHFILLDGGANVDCRPDMLVQFAIMGSCYMEKVMKVKSPKVGLINVGSEETKGRELEKEAYGLLSKAPVNFKGNCEAREIPQGAFDVIVSDGFTGNVVLKLYEGMGSFFSSTLKEMLFSGVRSKLAAVLILNKVKAFKKRMDYSEQGGAVLLGISKPVIKAHGSSNAKAFYNAIRQAKACVEGRVVEEIAASLAALKEGAGDNVED